MQANITISQAFTDGIRATDQRAIAKEVGGHGGDSGLCLLIGLADRHELLADKAVTFLADESYLDMDREKADCA